MRTFKNGINVGDCEKSDIAKHCWEADHGWDQKNVVDRESSIPRKIKKLHSLRNRINKVSYILREIWLPNLRQFLVTYLFSRL